MRGFGRVIGCLGMCWISTVYYSQPTETSHFHPHNSPTPPQSSHTNFNTSKTHPMLTFSSPPAPFHTLNKKSENQPNPLLLLCLRTALLIKRSSYYLYIPTSKDKFLGLFFCLILYSKYRAFCLSSFIFLNIF